MPYAVRADIENIFGSKNVEIWANLNNEDPESVEGLAHILARINWALEASEAEIDVLLGERGYDLPVSLDPIPIVLRDITAKLAAIKLYEGRGIQEYDEATGRARDSMYLHRKQVNDWLMGFRSGTVYIPGLDRSTTNAPGVVRDDEYITVKVSENNLTSPWFSA